MVRNFARPGMVNAEGAIVDPPISFPCGDQNLFTEIATDDTVSGAFGSVQPLDWEGSDPLPDPSLPGSMELHVVYSTQQDWDMTFNVGDVLITGAPGVADRLHVQSAPFPVATSLGDGRLETSNNMVDRLFRYKLHANYALRRRLWIENDPGFGQVWFDPAFAPNQSAPPPSTGLPGWEDALFDFGWAAGTPQPQKPYTLTIRSPNPGGTDWIIFSSFSSNRGLDYGHVNATTMPQMAQYFWDGNQDMGWPSEEGWHVQMAYSGGSPVEDEYYQGLWVTIEGSYLWPAFPDVAVHEWWLEYDAPEIGVIGSSISGDIEASRQRFVQP